MFSISTSELERYPMQPGDVYKTYADIDALHQAIGYQPQTELKKGLSEVVKWYREYYG